MDMDMGGRDDDRDQRGRGLTHVDERGTPRMVDVGDKDVTRRTARAGARVWVSADTVRLLKEQALPKGDAVGAARIAGIMAAKRTGDVVPLCHPLPLDHVDVERGLDGGEGGVAESVSTEGSSLVGLPVGTRLKVGECLLEVWQICNVC